MADQVIMLLPGYSLLKSGLVNQFLIDNGLSNDLRVVLAEYDDDLRSPTGEKIPRKKRCLGIEALNEKAAFYWTLKGSKELHKRFEEYEL